MIAENTIQTHSPALVAPGTLSVVLYDMHQEYSGGLASLPGRHSGSQVSCQRIWDFYAISETAFFLRGDQNIEVAEQQTLDAFLALFPEVAKRHGISDLSDCSGVFWRIQGNLQGVQRAFMHLLRVTNEAPSGDDDTFDYWPGAMRMLHEFATDLDSVTGNNHFIELYRPLTLLAGEWAEDISLPDLPDPKE